jgi:hypothetical protein
MPNAPAPSSPSRRPPTLLAAFAALAALALPATPARADELRLDDGRVLVGKVVARGQEFEVTTRDGVVVVPVAKVVRHRTDDELRRELQAQSQASDGSPFASLQLAQRAFAYGLERDMWRLLDETLAKSAATAADAPPADDERAAAARAQQRRLQEFLAQLEPELLPPRLRTANTATRVHQLLDLVRPDQGRAQRAAVVELLVREPNADADLRSEARRNGAERARLAALEALQRRAAAGSDRFVWRTAILDRSAAVREAAVALVPGDQAAAAVAYLAPGLLHQQAPVRVRTAEAFGGLGHRDALPLLVAAAPNAGKALAPAGGSSNGNRGHIAILNQQAYIRDFNVEVASASFIADPQIDVLASGTVLDATVVGVTEVRMILRGYRRALQRLAGSDPGEDPRRWAQWLTELPAPATPATTPARQR